MKLHLKQQGMTLVMLVFIVGLAAAGYLLHALNPTTVKIERDKKTIMALAEAKSALMGYAAGVNLALGGKRPGDLPCPDLNNDGSADTPCDNQSERLGRLPWKTLGLSDLRDGNGERLWYAVSNNFKNNTRTSCVLSGAAGCLNSDSGGTITVRNNVGTVVNDGTSTTSGVIAVVIAPGPPLLRQGAATAQDRSCVVGTNCDVTEKCTSSPASATPKCNVVNYLDLAQGEDNADFQDSSNSNGFIAGDINNSTIFNDRLLVITYNDLMPLLEKRVGGEVVACLKDYAAKTAITRGRYPFAAKLNSGSIGVNYSDDDEERFGRIPDTPFDKTKDKLDTTAASDHWTPSCMISSSSGWWLNWKELVFYGVANSYKPKDVAPVVCGSCLTVNPPSVVSNKKAVVIVAGRALPGQMRGGTGKNEVTNYLESENNSNDDIYIQGQSTSSFNDRLLFIQ